jgi:hypothetical protein
MMNVLHLLWIIPLAASFGFSICAIFAVGGRNEQK